MEKKGRKGRPYQKAWLQDFIRVLLWTESMQMTQTWRMSDLEFDASRKYRICFNKTYLVNICHFGGRK
jgi:hypothetical protein